MKSIYGMMIKVLATIMLCMSFSVVPIFAEGTTYTEGTLYYTIDNSSITITGCFGKDETVTVPSAIAGIPVNTIGKGSFTENEYVKTVNLPDTITTIEEGAFNSNIIVSYAKVSVSGTPTDQNESNKNDSQDQSTKNGSKTDSSNTKQVEQVKEEAKVSENLTSEEDVSFDEADVYLDEEDFKEGSASNEKANTSDEVTNTNAETTKQKVIACSILTVLIVGYLILKRKNSK